MADCPNCHVPLEDEFVISAGMSALGKRGRGDAKRRPTHVCKKAAKAGWKKRADQAAKNSLKPPGGGVPPPTGPTHITPP